MEESDKNFENRWSKRTYLLSSRSKKNLNLKNFGETQAAVDVVQRKNAGWQMEVKGKDDVADRA